MLAKDRDPQDSTRPMGLPGQKPHLACRRLTHAAGGFATPGWSGAVEADKGLLALQLVAGITVEGGSPPRVQVCHAHVPVGRPGREAAAQEVGWIGESREKGDWLSHANLSHQSPRTRFPLLRSPGGREGSLLELSHGHWVSRRGHLNIPSVP